MKKIISILLAALLICTMVSWPSIPAKAATNYDIQRQINDAAPGSTLNIHLESGLHRFHDEIFILKPITINFIGEPGAYIDGYAVNMSTGDWKGNRAFKILSDNVHLNFQNIKFNPHCQSYDNGGVIYIEGNNVSINGGTYYRNKCGYDSYGGAIYISNENGKGKNVTIENGQFEGFYYDPGSKYGYEADQGGAIYVSKGCDNATIKNCRFSGYATDNEGGAIYLNANYATIENCFFKNCMSKSNDAGAIFVNRDHTTIKNCYFENCIAQGSGSDGGAIKLSYVSTVDLRVEGCRFINCSAEGDGDWVDGARDTDIVHCTQPYGDNDYYCNCSFPSSSFECTSGSLNKIENDKPNCTQDGIKPYYQCVCGKVFSGPNPSSTNEIKNLNTWLRSDAARDPKLGHDFRYSITTGKTRRLTIYCTRSESHRASLTLLEKDSTYPGNTNKQWQDVVSGDDMTFWSELAAENMDFDVRYYVNTSRGWELTNPDNSGSLDPKPGDWLNGGYPPKYAGEYRLEVQVYKGTTPITGASVIQDFTIHPKQINSQMITLSASDPIPYSGNPETVTATVSDGGTTLIEGKDYVVLGGQTATAQGIYEFRIEGRGNYTGEAVAKWSITDADPLTPTDPGAISASDITFEDNLGKSLITGCEVTSGGQPVAGSFDWEDPSIIPETIGQATYNVVFTPNDPTFGIYKTTLTINVNQKDISGEVSIETPDTYNGNDLKDSILVTYQDQPLVKTTDYVVTAPTEVKEPGHYTAVVEFQGNYTGIKSQEFTVYRDLTERDVTFIVDDTYESDDAGDAITIMLDSTPLKRGVDYEIEGILDESKAPIEYKYPATITFMGIYRGTIEKEFVVTYPEPAPEPEPEPEPGPMPLISGGTIEDGTGNNPIDIAVTVSGSNMIVSDIPESTIESIANASLDPYIVINVSKTADDNESVTGVILSKNTAEALVRVLQSPDNEKNSLIIKTNSIFIRLNSAALASITRQAEGEAIQILIDYKDEEKLNDDQRAVVHQLHQSDGKSVEGIFEVFIESAGRRITNFEGGEIIVGKTDFAIPDGKNADHYFVYYLSESGQAVLHSTWAENGMILFRTSHLSDYAIVYDETMTNDTANPSNVLYILRSPATGE